MSLIAALAQAFALVGDTVAKGGRVLFVGNSYSFQVPKVFAKLAESKGKNVVWYLAVPSLKLDGSTEDGLSLRKRMNEKEVSAFPTPGLSRPRLNST